MRDGKLKPLRQQHYPPRLTFKFYISLHLLLFNIEQGEVPLTPVGRFPAVHPAG